jgi:hypothetical protein
VLRCINKACRHTEPYHPERPDDAARVPGPEAAQSPPAQTDRTAGPDAAH